MSPDQGEGIHEKETSMKDPEERSMRKEERGRTKVGGGRKKDSGKMTQEEGSRWKDSKDIIHDRLLAGGYA